MTQPVIHDPGFEDLHAELAELKARVFALEGPTARLALMENDPDLAATILGA